LKTCRKIGLVQFVGYLKVILHQKNSGLS
jgi:hypothetical protein